MYKIKAGTAGKCIVLTPNADAEVKDWVVRKNLEFTDCLINPIVVKTMVDSTKNTLAGTLATQGYALFGGDSGGDRRARYVLAVPYDKLEIK